MNRRAALVVIVVVAAGCTTPTPQLDLFLSGGPSQACPSTDCAQIPLPCDAYMSVRILDPKDPTAPYLSQCVQVPPNRAPDMCSLAKVDLNKTPIPVRDLEVQIAVFAASQMDVDPETGELRCPTEVQYAENGFPREVAPTPVLGGKAYYRPGDASVAVTLGCTDLPALTQSCTSASEVDITATVDDFQSRVPITRTTQGADLLRVAVGEPRVYGDNTVLSPIDTTVLLPAASDSTVLTWQGQLAAGFKRYACVEVYEDVARTTAVLRCRDVAAAPRLDLSGVRVSRELVAEVLTAIGLKEFPDEGLTIGVVVDAVSNGVPGYVVQATGRDDTQYTVEYMSDGGALSALATSSRGIFISRDAPFGTEFQTGGGRAAVSAIGGLVAGKLTVVMLQLE